MKRILLSVALGCAMLMQVWAQEPEKKSDEDPNAPEIKFETTMHDFGTVEYNGKAECEFTFTNVGKSPLIIETCSASCGCTAASCPKKIPIKPGEKNSIKVVYKNTMNVGGFNKTVTIRSNAKTSSVSLTVKGTVAAKKEASKAETTESK